MQFIKHFIVKHPFIPLVYIVYLMLWVSVVQASLAFAEARKASLVSGELGCGQGLAFLHLFALGFTVLYMAVTMIKFASSGQKRLYGYLLLFILIPAFAVTVWGYM